MSKLVSDVKAFRHAFGLLVNNRDPDFHSPELIHLQTSLIEEEFNEVHRALSDALVVPDDDRLCNAAQELVDLVYVAIGAAVSFGIPFDRVWDEVHQANMAKLGGGRREDGKVLKPDDWEPPNIRGALGWVEKE